MNISHILLFTLVLIVVTFPLTTKGNDTDGLRKSLGCLCSSNKLGMFGSCCSSYNNGASGDTDDIIQCFLSGNINSDSDNNINVMHDLHILFPLLCYLCVIVIQGKGLSVLPSGCFSSLTHLTSFLFYTIPSQFLNHPSLFHIFMKTISIC